MDKNKIIQTATKYLQRGQFDKAIAEYERILRKDPKDVRILLKLGEVQQKKGDEQQAASTLFEVAQSYAGDGFYLKAVAVYKQVLKLDPKRFEVNQRLADQYQQLGLLSDAMAQLQIVATWQKQSENLNGALETLRRMTELEPESVPARLELAEILEKKGGKGEALAELEAAAKTLDDARRTDDYLRVAERILKLKGGDPALSRKLAERYLAKGDAKRALARLQACYEAEPKNTEILEMLGKVFQDLGKQAKAVAAYKEMARSLREQGRSEEESRVWNRVRMLAPGDEEAGLAVGARSQSPIPARERVGTLDNTESRMILSSNTGTATAQGISLMPGAVDADTPVGKLLTEVDVYLKYRLYDKAKDHLQKVLAMDAGSVEAGERACLVYAALGDQGSLRQELMRLVRLHRAAGDPVRAAQRLTQLREAAPGDPEVEALAAESVPPPTAHRTPTPFNPFDDTSEAALFAATLAGDQQDEEIVDEPLLLDEEDDLVFGGQGAGDEEEEIFSLEDGEDAPLALGPNGLLGEVGAPAWEGALAGGREAQAPSAPQVPQIPQAAAPAPQVPQAAPPLPQAPQMPQAAPPAPPTPPAPVAPRIPAPAPVVSEPMAASWPELEELEEVDFYLGQQMMEEAGEILGILRSRHPGHPEVEKRLASLGAEAAPVPRPLAPPAQTFAPAASPAEAPPPQPTPARTVLVPPPPPFLSGTPAAPAALAPAVAVSAEAPAARSSEFGFARAVVPPQAEVADFDLGAELQAMMSDLSQIGSTEPAAPGESIQYSAEDVLAEFKKGISKTVRPEDSETHYNLGLAYREMGLLQEALESFRAVAASAVGQEREVGGWTMVGLCHAEMAAYEEAIAAFRKGLESSALTEEASKALNFEIARSLEQLGRPEDALAHYGKVARVDNGYRDVARAIMRLAGLDG